MMPEGPPELWGGIECTIARIRDLYRDEVLETGHRDREDDLDRVANLGIRTLRSPILWESLSRDGSGGPDFRWHDRRLGRLRQLGIRPIVGLVHHGSGPPGTSLVDPDFPRKLARHAERVARRYPWIDRYTPVNEPLTTARFSCLYGHWYPHERSYAAFLAALVIQCRATVLAMRAIRRVNPSAELVQTEDFGRVFSTPALAYQAEHENERRWLTFDLLTGRVDRHHPWWRILRDHGIAARDLDGLRTGEAAPDILGINHYLTSERYLDERVSEYPDHLVGGNEQDRYADVEAVRVPLGPGALGPAARLREVWERYGRPVAVTEVHHGCTRDEQLRWFAEVWRAACTVRKEGADVRAVTSWALFGAVDWNSLLTRQDGIYEPGPYDVRGPVPRPTALAAAIRDVVQTGDVRHPVLDGPGWWHRPQRFHSPQEPEKGTAGAAPSRRRILLIGPDDAVRQALLRAADERGLAMAVLGGDHGALAAATADLAAGHLWSVVATGVRSSELSQEGDLAAACRAHGRPFVALSDASALEPTPGRAATEDDAANRPGRAARREAKLRWRCPEALIIRAGALFGPWQRDGLLSTLLFDLAQGRPVRQEPDLVSPTYLPDLVHVLLDLLIDGETGIRHLTGGAVPHVELVRMLVERTGAAPPASAAHSDRPRPPPPALETTRGELMPALASALDRYLAACAFDWRLPATALTVAAE